MEEVPDGQYQKYSVVGGDYIRKDFFGHSPELARMVEGYTDDQLRKLRRGVLIPSPLASGTDTQRRRSRPW